MTKFTNKTGEPKVRIETKLDGYITHEREFVKDPNMKISDFDHVELIIRGDKYWGDVFICWNEATEEAKDICFGKAGFEF